MFRVNNSSKPVVRDLLRRSATSRNETPPTSPDWGCDLGRIFKGLALNTLPRRNPHPLSNNAQAKPAIYEFQNKRNTPISVPIAADRKGLRGTEPTPGTGQHHAVMAVRAGERT